MKIQEMIEAIKNGKKVRRECWSGDKFLYYVPSASYPARTGIKNSIADKDGEEIVFDGESNLGFYVGYLCRDKIFYESLKKLLNDTEKRF